MWENIAKLVGDNPITTIVITIIGTSTIWMYKEFKEMINVNINTKIAALNDKIKMLSQLQANILAIVHQDDNEQFRLKFTERFGEYNTVLRENTHRIAVDYLKYGDPSYLATLSEFISSELVKLNKEKARLSRDDETDVESYISKLYAPLKPILLIWSIVYFFLLTFTTYSVQHTWHDKLNVVILSISTFISISFVLSLVLLVLEKRLNSQGNYKWLLFTLIFLSPLLAVITSKETAILIIFVQITSIFLLYKHNKRKKSLIITSE
ncbi:hypothetical protein D3C81_1293690 [compost metagenome]